MANNVYYGNLEAKPKQLHCEKLPCVGLSIQDDPYLPINNGRFVNDVAIWLQIEFGNIFGYFITRRVVYTQQQQWRIQKFTRRGSNSACDFENSLIFITYVIINGVTADTISTCVPAGASMNP